MEHARCAKLKLGVEGEAMDMNFLRAHAERCRSLAESADEFTKQRLLATRFLKAPIDLVDAPKRNVAER